MRGIALLAKTLGISTGTVSRALNGKADVSAETRDRVLAAARKLGYAPNQAARALARGVTQSVGFMIDLNPETAASSDYFFMGVFDGVQSRLGDQGLDLLVLPCPTGQNQLAYLDRFVRRGVVDAMILAAVQRTDARIDLLRQVGMPFVTLGRSAKSADHAWIDLDFETTASVALQRLYDRGHRRIGVTVPRGDVNFGHVFLDTYRQFLDRHGLPFAPELVVPTSRTEAAGHEAMATFLDLAQPPTAVLLIYEVTAIGLYRCLFERGLTPGQDIAVVAFRDEPTIRFLRPSLTRFSLPLRDLGQELGTALLAQIPRMQTAFPQGRVQMRYPLQLIEGQSDAMTVTP